MKLIVKSGGAVIASFTLSAKGEYTLGAAEDCDLPVSGEKYLSRRHATLRLDDDELVVERTATARNPLLFKGQPRDQFRLRVGDFFVIGGSAFHCLEAGAELPANLDAPPREHAPAYQFTLGADELRARGSRDDRLRLLDLMELPEVLRTRSRTEFFVYAAGLLRTAAGAQWARVMEVRGEEHRVLAEDAAFDRTAPKPVSRALLNAAIAEAPRPVTHCWSQGLEQSLEATAYQGVDWAISCAMAIPGEPPVLFYVAGTSQTPGPMMNLDTQSGARLFLRDTARLVGLVADILRRAIALQKVELWQSRLGHFFSAKLAAKILEADATVELAPRIAEATVMFFDIRGFSRLTEGNLQRILDYQGDLRRVLTAMTQCIFDHDGVVLRYMGDGILGCWNVPYAVQDHVARACDAALEMVERMGEVTRGWAASEDCPCGIGLGVGEVVAGSLGSEQVYAYDLLGAVANQTARVEGITKVVEVPILVTKEVAARLSAERFLTRRVARFRPVGMEQTLDLFTIERTPADEGQRLAAQERIAAHERGLAAFETGDWKTAYDILHDIAKQDAAARYVHTLASPRKPPRDWDGVVNLTAK
jgi:adenylate cyclase